MKSRENEALAKEANEIEGVSNAAQTTQFNFMAKNRTALEACKISGDAANEVEKSDETVTDEEDSITSLFLKSSQCER